MKSAPFMTTFGVMLGFFLLAVLVRDDVAAPSAAAVAQVTPVEVVIGGDESAVYKANYDVVTLTTDDGRVVRMGLPSAGAAPLPEGATQSWYMFTASRKIRVTCSQGLVFNSYQILPDGSYLLVFRTRADTLNSVMLKL